MSRQHATPLLLKAGEKSAVRLEPLNLHGAGRAVSEADIQNFIHEHPTVLPIAEVDPMFAGAVSVCRELTTSAGSIDNFMVTPSGLPVLVECKLWRNPEGRREVVGQILDYAKELSRWSSSDVQRIVSRRLNRTGNPLLEIVRAADPTVDEVAFNDALSANLRRGRFLLLIVGDGIREGTEAIAEYLQRHAGLHFSLGLVELPIYELPDGGRLVAPRILARANIITRNVISLPEKLALEEATDAADEEDDVDPELVALGDTRQRFWAAFLGQLKLDDPEQPMPRPPRQGHVTFSLPAPAGSSWLCVYRDLRKHEVGVFLSSSRNTPGEYAMRAVAEQWEQVQAELGGNAQLVGTDDRPQIRSSRSFGDLEKPEVRKAAFAWLSERVNAFVNALRPRVRSAVADLQARGD